MQERDHHCIIIAEVAQSHDGSLGQAHAFIDAAVAAGADVIKFQTHIAAAESTPAEPWRVKFSKQDDARYDYWKRMEFTPAQWKGLKDHADESGIKFISSPFSMEAVTMLSEIGVWAWKIASGELTNKPMFEAMAATEIPFILSSGMSNWEEIDECVEMIQAKNADLTLLQCTSMYPTPAEKMGLNVMQKMRERYGCKVGLSDHSGTIYAGLAAAALRADMIEVHITLSKHMFGPDVPVSLDPGELKQLVDGVRFIERMNNSPVDKDAVAQELQPMRKLFNKSIVAATDIAAGTVLTEAHIAYKKPGTGMPPTALNSLLGKTTKQPIAADTLLDLAFFA